MVTGVCVGRSLGNISWATGWAALPQAIVTYGLDPAGGGHLYLTCIYLAWLEASQGMFSSKIAEVQGPGRTPQAHL